jgi:hypothetical protein
LEIESSIEPDIAAMTDRELLEGIYRYLSGMNDTVGEVKTLIAPTLEAVSKSPMGKMLGIR